MRRRPSPSDDDGHRRIVTGEEHDDGNQQEQADQWGPGARDWADYNEPTCTPFYQAVLDATGVGEGTNLLDVGCGADSRSCSPLYAAPTVSGFDATTRLSTSPGSGCRRLAHRRRHGRSAALDAGAFDVVTAFNTIQFVSDPIAAVKNMSQVTKPGGLISIVVWGPPEQCESAIMFQEMGPLMPPPPADAPKRSPGASDGRLENAAANAGLTILAVADVPNPLIYPDLATAVAPN